MNPTPVREYTQSVIAVVLVIGSLVFAFLKPDSPALSGVMGVLGTVVAYYFLSSQRAETIKQTVAELKSQMLNPTPLKEVKSIPKSGTESP